MATLDLDINCMCLFATDEQTGTVHVLMPATHDHGDRHVVRLFHRSLPDQEEGVPMEGWALNLGRRPGPQEAGSAQRPPELDDTGASEAEIVDLTRITDRTIPPALAGPGVYPHDLAARITLFSGAVTEREDESTTWLLNGVERVMAHKVVWRIENIPEELSWEDLGASVPRPLESLAALDPEPDGTYRLEVHHVTRKALPPTGFGVLNEHEVQHHFEAFYKLLNVRPTSVQLPALAKGPEGGKYNCKTAQGTMG